MRHDRGPLDPFVEGHFDLCGCAQLICPRVVQQGAGNQCGGCGSMYCQGCRHDDLPRQDLAISICKYCDAFLCLVGECDGDPEEDGWLSVSCNVCEELICLECFEYANPRVCKECGKSLCRECTNTHADYYTECDCCGGYWCSGCASRNGMYITCEDGDAPPYCLACLSPRR